MNIFKEILFLLTATFSICLSVALFSKRNKIFYLLLIFSALPYSCKRSQKQQNNLESYAPKVVEAHGYVVPKDSMAEPKVILAGNPRIIAAGKPKKIPVPDNIRSVGIPKVIPAGVAKICTPGQNGFSLPEIVSVIGTPVTAGLPEVVITEPVYGEQDSENFSSFGQLQGLKSPIIYCAMQDRNGNLWFGTNGGGVTRYDGRSFSHFSEQQGLKSNFVRSMLEDRHGNIWFGMGLGGVTKYDGKTFTYYPEKQGVRSYTVNSIAEDKAGNLWFATAMAGVSKFDNKTFTYFTKKEGLINDTVHSILSDKQDNLWIGTMRGL